MAKSGSHRFSSKQVGLWDYSANATMKRDTQHHSDMVNIASTKPPPASIIQPYAKENKESYASSGLFDGLLSSASRNVRKHQ
jgi:hypothetical protein